MTSPQHQLPTSLSGLVTNIPRKEGSPGALHLLFLHKHRRTFLWCTGQPASTTERRLQPACLAQQIEQSLDDAGYGQRKLADVSFGRSLSSFRGTHQPQEPPGQVSSPSGSGFQSDLLSAPCYSQAHRARIYKSFILDPPGGVGGSVMTLE